jgi:cation diffusion facilitator family transporter
MQQERYIEAKFVTLVGAAVNALLGIIKILGGIFFRSHALVADGIHSLSDLLTDIMVIFASKYGSRDADITHPYGHQRIETAATLFLALLLILAGICISWDSFNDLLKHFYKQPAPSALLIAAISIFANEALFHYTKQIGLRIKSDLVIANAWHHRSDALSSVVVLFGLLGSLLGFIYLDAIAAVIVGLLIIKMGLEYGINCLKELIDTAIDPELFACIEKAILSITGVKKIHQLRSRSMGRDVFIDVHIQVSPYISVSEGHYIAQHVHHFLVENIEQLKDVTVHVDPEDDEICCPSISLPNRPFLEDSLLKPWKIFCPEIKFWILHYLDGKLIIDLFCEGNFKQWDVLRNLIEHDLAKQNNKIEVRFFASYDSSGST